MFGAMFPTMSFKPPTGGLKLKTAQNTTYGERATRAVEAGASGA